MFKKTNILDACDWYIPTIIRHLFNWHTSAWHTCKQNISSIQDGIFIRHFHNVQVQLLQSVLHQLRLREKHRGTQKSLKIPVELKIDWNVRMSINWPNYRAGLDMCSGGHLGGRMLRWVGMPVKIKEEIYVGGEWEHEVSRCERRTVEMENLCHENKNYQDFTSVRTTALPVPDRPNISLTHKIVHNHNGLGNKNQPLCSPDKMQWCHLNESQYYVISEEGPHKFYNAATVKNKHIGSASQTPKESLYPHVLAHLSHKFIRRKSKEDGGHLKNIKAYYETHSLDGNPHLTFGVLCVLNCKPGGESSSLPAPLCRLTAQCDFYCPVFGVPAREVSKASRVTKSISVSTGPISAWPHKAAHWAFMADTMPLLFWGWERGGGGGEGGGIMRSSR